jgi:hypothetical protein
MDSDSSDVRNFDTSVQPSYEKALRGIPRDSFSSLKMVGEQWVPTWPRSESETTLSRQQLHLSGHSPYNFASEGIPRKRLIPHPRLSSGSISLGVRGVGSSNLPVPTIKTSHQLSAISHQETRDCRSTKRPKRETAAKPMHQQTIARGVAQQPSPWSKLSVPPPFFESPSPTHFYGTGTR